MFVDHEGVYHERFCDSVSDRSHSVSLTPTLKLRREFKDNSNVFSDSRF